MPLTLIVALRRKETGIMVIFARNFKIYKDE